MISSGAIAKDNIICRGKNYEDKGVRNDDHDAVGVKLRVPCRKETGGAPQHPGGGGATQPTSNLASEEEDDEVSKIMTRFRLWRASVTGRH